ncbi:MAG: hypothetical protein IT337_17660 [Thermomicrobiales bacterium]|nr:hypothetical protein [Thermomicrobiales bacterium]
MRGMTVARGGVLHVKLARIAVVSTTALALVVGTYGMTAAEGRGDRGGDVPAVVITGGTITNDTTLTLGADGGSGLADASGGSHNVGVTNSGSLGTASVGNGGAADAQANGGAITVGNINSGQNAGNAITVGNTNAGKPEGKPEGKPSGKPEGKPSGEVVALPSTGIGGIDAGILSAIAAAGAAAAAGMGLRRR